MYIVEWGFVYVVLLVCFLDLIERLSGCEAAAIALAAIKVKSTKDNRTGSDNKSIVDELRSEGHLTPNLDSIREEKDKELHELEIEVDKAIQHIDQLDMRIQRLHHHVLDDCDRIKKSLKPMRRYAKRHKLYGRPKERTTNQ